MSTTTSLNGIAGKGAVSGGLRENAVFKNLFVNPWTYVTGAVMLGFLNVILMAGSGGGWGVTTAFAYWAAWIWNGFGGNSHSWTFFSQVNPIFNKPGFDFLHDRASLLDVGVIGGALLATLLASQARFKKIKSGKQVVAAILGGLLMGFGARLSFGCNIGAMFTGLPSMSLHGWVFMVFIFLGAAVGSKLLVKFFI
jgi:hypothetical protein